MAKKDKSKPVVVEDAGIEETPSIEAIEADVEQTEETHSIDVAEEEEEETEEVSEVEQVIVAVEAVKEAVVKVLGGDAEKFFVPLEAALEFKKNQDEFSEENVEEATQKQVEAREAEILAMQEEAARKLEELYGKNA